MNPKISLVMGVYNGERHLRESIESVLSQTVADFEFIVVDDASVDKTAEILSVYAREDSRLKIVTNNSNLGLTKSLNVGVLASRGEYIARMDAGDTSEPERFARQVEFLEKNTDHVLVGSWAYTIDEESHRVGVMKHVGDDASIRKMLIRHNPIVHSSIMVRKDVLEKAGNYNELWRYGQDYELYFRIMKYGKLANLPKCLVSYRLSPHSITRKKNNKQIGFAIKARMKAIKSGQYGVLSYVYLIAPTIGMLLPYKVKEFIKKL